MGPRNPRVAREGIGDRVRIPAQGCERESVSRDRLMEGSEVVAGMQEISEEGRF